MDTKTIATLLAGLTGAVGGLACAQSETAVTEVPGAAAHAHADEAGEHVSGDHSHPTAGTHELADARPAVVRSFVVAPGKFAEANFEMTQGSVVTAVFSEATGDLEWDVHSHDHAGGTKIHDKGAGGAGTVEFTAPEDGVFSILWKNGGAASTPLEVSITLEPGASIDSWMPAE